MRELKLTRAEVQLPVTTTRIRTVNGEKLGYVDLAAFTEELR